MLSRQGESIIRCGEMARPVLTEIILLFGGMALFVPVIANIFMRRCKDGIKRYRLWILSFVINAVFMIVLDSGTVDCTCRTDKNQSNLQKQFLF